MAECKFCGEEGLHWEAIGGKWLLLDEEEERHTCGRDLRQPACEEFSAPEPTEDQWSAGEAV